MFVGNFNEEIPSLGEPDEGEPVDGGEIDSMGEKDLNLNVDTEKPVNSDFDVMKPEGGRSTRLTSRCFSW